MTTEYSINLENKTKNELILFIKKLQNMLKEQQEENEKKDKQIDLMAEYINEIDVSEEICEGKTICDENCKECTKKYFKNKAEKE